MLIEKASKEAEKRNHMLVPGRQPELYITTPGPQIALCYRQRCIPSFYKPVNGKNNVRHRQFKVEKLDGVALIPKIAHKADECQADEMMIK